MRFDKTANRLLTLFESNFDQTNNEPWYYPSEMFETKIGIPAGTISRRYNIPPETSEEALATNCQSKRSVPGGMIECAASLFDEIIALNPDVREELSSSGFQKQMEEKDRFDVVWGVLSRFNMSDILWYLKTNGNNKKRSQYTQNLMKVGITAFFMMSPETHKTVIRYVKSFKQNSKY